MLTEYHSNVNWRQSVIIIIIIIISYFVSGGHYTAYCRHPTTQQWFEYDDSYVTDVSVQTVQQCQAYVLFYQRADCVPNDLRSQYVSLHLPLSTYLSPPTSLHLPLSTYLSPPTSLHLPLSTYLSRSAHHYPP